MRKNYLKTDTGGLPFATAVANVLIDLDDELGAIEAYDRVSDHYLVNGDRESFFPFVAGIIFRDATEGGYEGVLKYGGSGSFLDDEFLFPTFGHHASTLKGRLERDIETGKLVGLRTNGEVRVKTPAILFIKRNVREVDAGLYVAAVSGSGNAIADGCTFPLQQLHSNRLYAAISGIDRSQ